MTSVVHERLFSQVVERAEHYILKESATREMTTHGQIGEFHGDLESWTSYMEQLECYFVVNDVADARKQRTILLSCCSASA